MLIQIGIAAIVMLITTAMHAAAMMFSLRKLATKLKVADKHIKWMQLRWVSGAVLLMFLVTILEVLVWTAAFLFIGALESFEPAFYFSMVTYTTLGYGDVLLTNEWRLLGSFEAAHGVIMLGWTTAIVIAIVQRVYFKHGD